MGGVLKAVGKLVGASIGLPFVWLRGIFGIKLFDSLLEPIMGFFGFKDETIYSTEVIAVRLFDEDLYTKIQRDLHLEYMAKGYGAIDYANNYAKTGDNQFGRYYRTGKWDYLDYLPTGQITTTSINKSAINSVIEANEGSEITITDIIHRIPTDDVWVKYRLQSSYNYDIGRNVMKYGNVWYRLGSITYQTNNNTFSVVMNPITIITSTYHHTFVTITKIDDLTDNKNTKIIANTLYLDNVTGSVLYETVENVSNTDEVIPTGTAKDSYTVVFVPEEDEEGEGEGEGEPVPSITFNISNHTNVPHYVVEYVKKSTGQTRYWLHDSSSGYYNIPDPNKVIVNFEMLPIVMLRNSGFNVNQYQASDRPASVTQKRYKQTVRMLKSIGMDLDDVIEKYSDNPDINNISDAFFLLGVSPSDTNPIVSKVLYETFDAIYDTVPSTGPGTAYSMAVKEDPYNAVITWTMGDVSTYNGTVHNKAVAGECSHSIKTFTTVVNTYDVKEVTLSSNNNEYWVHPKLGRRVTVRTYRQIETLSDGVVIQTEISHMQTTTAYENSFDYDNGVINTNPLGTVKTLTRSENMSVQGLRILKQLTKTTYKQMDIRNLQAVSVIRGSGFATGNKLPIDSKNLVIPLALPLVARLTFMEKTALLGRSAHLIFYAAQKTHLEWYETQEFAKYSQVFMIALIVVITIYSFGTMTGPALTLNAALMAVLEIVAISIAVQLALKLITKYVDDPALKAALSLAVMVVGAYFGLGNDFGMNGLTALTLSACCVNAAAIYIGDVTADGMDRLTGNVKDFNAEYKKREEEQQKALKSQTSGLDAFDMVDLSTNIDMFSTTGTNTKTTFASLLSPSQFFYLATNQAAYNHDLMYTGLYDNAVHEFVSNKLQLGILGV